MKLLVLLFVLFVVVVTMLWYAPKPARPWFRAALLLAFPYYFAPRTSFVIWLVWLGTFVLAAAVVLALDTEDKARQ